MERCLRESKLDQSGVFLSNPLRFDILITYDAL